MQDVDEDEVEEAISDDCMMEMQVQVSKLSMQDIKKSLRESAFFVKLKVPIYTASGGDKVESGSPRSPLRQSSKSAPTITQVRLVNFTRESFEFDVTWFTESFHLLEQIWSKQAAMLRHKLPTLVRRAFQHAIRTVSTDEWIKNKFRTLDAEIQALSRIETTTQKSTSTTTVTASTETAEGTQNRASEQN